MSSVKWLKKLHVKKDLRDQQDSYQDRLVLFKVHLYYDTIKTNCKRDNKNQPEQLWPFPMYPGLQLQLKDPSVLVQVAFSLQL